MKLNHTAADFSRMTTVAVSRSPAARCDATVATRTELADPSGKDAGAEAGTMAAAAPKLPSTMIIQRLTFMLARPESAPLPLPRIINL
jgi:hypothetical protein